MFEWLSARPGFSGRVAAFGSWDVLPSILNTDRSRLPVGTGWTPVPSPSSDRERAINELAGDLPRYWNYGPFDAPIVYAALEHIRSRKPRVLYLMLGEGDEWAHEARYDLYLDATQRADRFVERIWATLQSLPEYRGTTTLIISPDHGRGATTEDWIGHSARIPHSDETWLMVLGPDTPAAGEAGAGTSATQSQIAATIAALLGEDFRAEFPVAAAPLAAAGGPAPR